MSSPQFPERYNRLNPEQKLAVDTIDGPVLVIAGPGSGKTEILSLRTAKILLETDTLPSSILCLTFTDSAAQNMRDRLSKLIGPEAYKVVIHTFHSFGTEIINRNPEYFFFGAGFQPADQLAQLRLLREIFVNLEWNNPLKSFHQDHDFTFLKDAQQVIMSLKKAGLTPGDLQQILEVNQAFLQAATPSLQAFFEGRISSSHVQKLPELLELLSNLDSQTIQNNKVFPTLKILYTSTLQDVLIQARSQVDLKKTTIPLSEWKKDFLKLNAKKELVPKDFSSLEKHFALASIYKQYQEKLYQAGLFDFEDMLLEVVKALEDKTKPELKYNYQERYLYIMVDEFQDTNGLQIRLLDSLLEQDLDFEPNILAVGDDDQAVFKFQGASLENILQFKQKFPQTKIIPLTKNYRSTQNILDFATKVIEQSTQRLSTLEGLDKTLVSQVK